MLQKCVVTGGAGFIGSYLVELLLAEGYEVHVIDSLVAGQETNLRSMKANPAFTFVKADIRDRAATMELMKGADWVFHLAALADIVPSIQMPFAYHSTNVDGTFNVLEAARSAGVKRFIYAASSSCYGIPDNYPTPEETPPQPMYPYALTKWMGEQYVMHWCQLYKLPVLSLRMFNVYGPRARTAGTYGSVFGVFLAQKLNDLPFTIVGDGTQTRDFTFVTDAAHAFLAAARSEVSGEIMNIGSNNTYSINKLVELLGGEVTYIPRRPGEPDCTYADTTKIKTLLGWSPTVSLERGVEIMLENIEYWREAPVWTPDTIEVATEDWFHYLEK